MQNISDLWIQRLNGEYLYRPIFPLSVNAQSVCFFDCILSSYFVEDLCSEIKKCKKLTRLQLTDNKHNFQGDTMGQIISPHNVNAPLQVLNLEMFLMPEDACVLLASTMALYKHITQVNLSHNHLGQAGHNLAESIRTWGAQPPLMVLCLNSCSIPADAWHKLLKSLSTCQHLTCLRLSENTLTRSLSSFLSQPCDRLNLLEELWLSSSELDAKDIEHLWCLIETRKIPGLKFLDMEYNNMSQMETTLQEFITKCVNYNREKLKIKLGNCNISESLQQELTRLCEGTNIELSFKKNTKTIERTPVEWKF